MHHISKAHPAFLGVKGDGTIRVLILGSEKNNSWEIWDSNKCVTAEGKEKRKRKFTETTNFLIGSQKARGIKALSKMIPTIYLEPIKVQGSAI